MLSLLRTTLYRWLREGRTGSRMIYYVAGLTYWLFFARQVYVGARIVEIPWLLEHLQDIPDGAKILQVGDVILKKALPRHQEWLIDLEAEETSQTGLTVYQSDIREVHLPSSHFDVAVVISTLEHIGLQGPRFDDGDKIAMDIITKALKPNGLLFLTVPFGIPRVKYEARTYGESRLRLILDDTFEILEEKFLAWDKFAWRAKSLSDMEKLGPLLDKWNTDLGVCLIKARRLKSNG